MCSLPKSKCRHKANGTFTVLFCANTTHQYSLPSFSFFQVLPRSKTPELFHLAKGTADPRGGTDLRLAPGRAISAECSTGPSAPSHHGCHSQASELARAQTGLTKTESSWGNTDSCTIFSCLQKQHVVRLPLPTPLQMQQRVPAVDLKIKNGAVLQGHSQAERQADHGL